MLTFLLDTKLGHLALGLLCVSLAFGGGWLRGALHERHAMRVHYEAVVASQAAVIAKAQAVMASNTVTIKALSDANASFADAMKGNAKKLSQAAEQLKATQIADAKALAAAQAKIHEIEKTHGDAHAWAVTAVPDSVLTVLGVRKPADDPH